MIDLGSLNDHLAQVDEASNVERSLFLQARQEGDTASEALLKAAQQMKAAEGFGASSSPVNVLESAGPISDAYIRSTEPMSLITGPGGSGKTTASTKKALFETVRIYPGPDGVRRYVVGVWRQKYDNLWGATIPSWWKILPQDFPGSSWTGARPRAAEQLVRFKDQWGPCLMVVRFRAFGESMDPDDILGNEQTDAYLNEWTTMPEALAIALVDRVGRDPPRAIMKRTGRIYGDSNAPDVLNYCYRDFYETPPPGYVLFRQPGGLDHGAENLKAMGREYYENSARINAHRPWWVKRMVHARPGFTRDADPVYEAFDDDMHVSKVRLEASKMVPVVVGIDGGFTPAAVYTQVIGRQARILGEVALERGGMKELGEAMLEYEARRFPGCEFVDFCDPSMGAGEDIEGEVSDRGRLSEVLQREVSPARTNQVDARTGAVKEYLGRQLGPGKPGLLLDPTECKCLRRGFNQTFHYKRTRGSNDISSIEKTPDSHPHDGLSAAALHWGTDAATMRRSENLRALEQRRQAARDQPRRNPLARRA